MNEADYVKDRSLVYHRFIEAFKFAYVRRTELADPDFVKDIDKVVAQLTDPVYAEKTRLKINDKKTHGQKYYELKHSDKLTTGTTHLVVLGPEGDGVTVMSTVNG